MGVAYFILPISNNWPWHSFQNGLTYQASTADGSIGQFHASAVKKRYPIPMLPMPWFHSTISRLEAEKLLDRNQDGQFLLRISHNTKGKYALAIRWVITWNSCGHPVEGTELIVTMLRVCTHVCLFGYGSVLGYLFIIYRHIFPSHVSVIPVSLAQWVCLLTTTATCSSLWDSPVWLCSAISHCIFPVNYELHVYLTYLDTSH